MTTMENIKFTIGTVSMNIFDDKGLLNSGIRDLNIWPFYEIDSRLGCMKEYNGYSASSDSKVNYKTLFSKLFIEIESFTLPMYYSPRTDEDMANSKYSFNPEDEEDRKNLIDCHVSNSDLANLKKILNKNPLQDLNEEEKGNFSPFIFV